MLQSQNFSFLLDLCSPNFMYCTTKISRTGLKTLVRRKSRTFTEVELDSIGFDLAKTLLFVFRLLAVLSSVTALETRAAELGVADFQARFLTFCDLPALAGSNNRSGSVLLLTAYAKHLPIDQSQDDVAPAV